VVRTLRTKVRRDLLRRPAQYVAVAVTLVLGVALFGASYDAYQNLQASYAKTYEDLRFADLTVTGGPSEQLVDRGRTLGVQATEIRTQVDLPMQIGGTKLLGRVVGLPPDGAPAVDRIRVTAGATLDPSMPDGVVVEKHTAQHFGLHPDDQVRAHGPNGWTTVRVLGVASSPEYIWPALSRQQVLIPPDDFGVLFVPQPLAEELAGTGAPRQALFSYGDVPDPDAVTASLTRMADQGGALDVFTQLEQPSNAALQEDVQGFSELSLLFPILFLGAAAMATYVLLTRLVQAQRPLIGTLSAVGFGGRTLFAHYLTYGLAVGLAGSVLGAVLGVLGAGAVSRVYTAAVGIPETVVRIHWITPLIGILLGTLAGAVAAGLPALTASRVEPAEAMRGMTPVRSRRHPFARLGAPLRRLPARWKLVVRSVGRAPKRTLSTIAGVILALVLVLVSWGMLDTTTILLSRQFDRIERQDAQVIFTGVASSDALRQIAGTPGVAAAEPAADLGVTIVGGTGRYQTSLLGLEPGTSMHAFLLDDGTDGRLSEKGVFVGSALRKTLGLSEGDRVELTVPSASVTLRKPVAGFVDEPLGTYAYIGLPVLGADAVNSALVRYIPGVDRSRMRTRLGAVSGVGAVIDAEGLQEEVGAFMRLFYAFVGIMLLFGALMAFALIFAMMSVNLAERSTELATLRAEGVGRRTTAGLITRENLIVTALGVVPGLAIGYAVAWSFMASFSSDLFSFSLSVKPLTFVWCAAAVLGVALMSNWPAVRAVDRLDVARVVRERSL
jgi:putative ABC transport system permease protein